MIRKNDSIKLAICIITYKRPILLRQCLESLAKQKFNKNNQPDCRLVIIDNDSSQPLDKEYGSLNTKLFREVIHEQEPQQGVSSARNHAIRAAGDVDFVVFIDDDEIATPYWLDELIYCQRQFEADIVTGPVIPKSSDHCPDWVQKGNFFKIDRYHSGVEVDHVGNGNVLIRSPWLKSFPGPYDIRMNLIGGEDTLFFTLLRKRGAKIIWCDEAIAFEDVPNDRMTIRYILFRAMKFGSVITFVETITENPVKVRAIRFIKGTVRILKGILTVIPNSIIKGLAGLVQSLETIATGLGEILGIFGLIPQDYK